MIIRTLAAAFLCGFLLTACRAGARRAIDGKYILSERPEDADAPDAIEFRPDGTCLVEAGGHAGIAGIYRALADGHLKIEADTGTRKEYAFKYELLTNTLTLAPDDDTSLIYVRWPEGPHPQFSEIVGIFSMHNEQGDSAGEITADYKFRDHLHDLDAEEHTYYDVHIDGKCTYADGIVTYFPEHSDAPQQDKYLRDFIVKRDAKGLWVVDPFHDTIVCEPPAANLDLPPPPDGYQPAKQPGNTPDQPPSPNFGLVLPTRFFEAGAIQCFPPSRKR